MFAHSLGLWERLGGRPRWPTTADLLVGLAQLIAEANGLAGVGHIREKISEMIIHATLVRAASRRRSATQDAGRRRRLPDELYTNAGKYHGAANFTLMVRHLHDIAGGAVLTAPTPGRPREPRGGPRWSAST